jgi:hypothetical protein
VSQSGIYHVEVPGACQNWTSADIVVSAISPADAVAQNTAVSPGNQAVLNATGDNLQWFDAANGGALLGAGNTFTTPALFAPTTYYVQSRTIFGADSANVGKNNQTNTGSSFSGNQALNYAIRFDVLQACTINEFTVYTDTVFGIRKVLVKDQATNLTVDSAYIDVQNDTATVTVDLNLQPGSYYITTDSLQNTLLWGNGGPRLRRSNSQVAYPYTFPNVLTITSSDQGTQFYYYFYKWKVSTEPTICNGNMIPVLVDILTAANESMNEEGIAIFPNPTSEQLYITANSAVEGVTLVSFTDLAGRLVQQNSYQSLGAGSRQQINISQLSKGVYFVKVKSARSEHMQRLVIE